MNARGMALIVGLILLAATSLLALAASGGMVLQRHQAANFGERALALENAQIADHAARAWLFSRPDIDRQAGCASNCLLPPAIHNADEIPDAPEFESAAWWRANAVAAGLHPETGAAVSQASSGAEAARWIIEEMHYQPLPAGEEEPAAEGVAWYRILSRGSGKRPSSVAVTETIAARPWQGDYAAAPYPPQSEANAFCRQFSGRYPCGVVAWRQRR